jgi:hypothetical protein
LDAVNKRKLPATEVGYEGVAIAGKNREYPTEKNFVTLFPIDINALTGKMQLPDCLKDRTFI